VYSTRRKEFIEEQREVLTTLVATTVAHVEERVRGAGAMAAVALRFVTTPLATLLDANPPLPATLRAGVLRTVEAAAAVAASTALSEHDGEPTLAHQAEQHQALCRELLNAVWPRILRLLTLDFPGRCDFVHRRSLCCRRTTRRAMRELLRLVVVRMV
jgi:hypothetical protein